MPKLYIANATSQVQEFLYWLPESVPSRYLVQSINLGSQIQVPGPGRDLPQPAIDGILEQHRKYGLVEIGEALRGTHFYGLAYSIDKPVSFEQLQRLVTRYRGILEQRGKDTRQAAAIATNEYVENMLFERQLPDQLQTVEVSVEEMSRPEGFEGPELSEGVRVVRGEQDAPRYLRSRRRR